MNTFLRNTISELYNAASAPVASTQDALAERLQSVRDTAFLLYIRMMENMGYGQQGRLKDIVEKEAEEEEQPAVAKEEEKKPLGPATVKEQQQQDDDDDGQRYDTLQK